MPIIHSSSYEHKGIFKNKHLQTIIPFLLRRVSLSYRRERITTPDTDFLDLDWSTVKSNRLCILLHGLASNTHKPYMKGMAKALNARGIDVVALNYRGCSGTTNLLPSAYHSGKTDDIDVVLQHLISHYTYKEISLVGMSVGGNITLKYLGEKGSNLSPLIRKAAALNCPIDLESASNHFLLPENKIYLQRFIKGFKQTLKEKHKHFPGLFDPKKIHRINTFWDLDNYYTAPFHGFKNAKDYYKQASSLPLLHRIAVPTLQLSAKNDPFLSKENYPVQIAENHRFLFLEMPAEGGHLGYYTKNSSEYWHETRVADFIAAKHY